MDKTFYGAPDADIEVKVMGDKIVLILRENGRLTTRRLTAMEAHVMSKAMRVASQQATISHNTQVIA